MLFPKIVPSPSGSSPHVTHCSPLAKPTHRLKRHLDRFSRFCMGPKCYAVQCVVNGEENSQNCPFTLGIRHPAGAAGGGPIHGHWQYLQKFGRDQKCRSGISWRKDRKRIHRHTNHNTCRRWVHHLLYHASRNYRGHCKPFNTNFSTLIYLQMDYHNSQRLNSPLTL